MLERLRSVDWRTFLNFQLHLRPTLRGIPYWIAAVVVGFVAVTYSELFTFAINLSTWAVTNNRYSLFLLSPACFVLSVWLVRRVAPTAGGTGVAQVTAVVQMDFRKSADLIAGFLSIRVAAVVMASSILCVLGAGALGREGPMVHIAACVFYFVARQATVFWPYTEHRSWVIAGGAAGVAAAFNTPLAGIVFVLEELAQQHFHQFKTVVISAVIVAGLTSQWLSGRYLFLGYPKIESVRVATVLWAALVGISCGCGAGLFDRMLRVLHARISPLSERTPLGVAAACGLVVAGFVVFLDVGTIGGGISTVQDLLFNGQLASWQLLIGRFMATIVSHLSGCSGGFLAPALSIGGLIGSKTAQVFSPGDHNLLVMVGMAAFLSAVVRAPFTALVIVMEMTDRHSAIFPLMMGALIGLGVKRLIVDRGVKA